MINYIYSHLISKEAFCFATLLSFVSKVGYTNWIHNTANVLGIKSSMHLLVFECVFIKFVEKNIALKCLVYIFVGKFAANRRLPGNLYMFAFIISDYDLLFLHV